jgi:hypothetical protein
VLTVEISGGVQSVSEVQHLPLYVGEVDSGSVRLLDNPTDQDSLASRLVANRCTLTW